MKPKYNFNNQSNPLDHWERISDRSCTYKEVRMFPPIDVNNYTATRMSYPLQDNTVYLMNT